MSFPSLCFSRFSRLSPRSLFFAERERRGMLAFVFVLLIIMFAILSGARHISTREKHEDERKLKNQYTRDRDKGQKN